MSEENKELNTGSGSTGEPVENIGEGNSNPNAGGEQQTNPVAEKLNELERTVSEALEAKAKAEEKVVKLKKQLKDSGIDEEPEQREDISEVVARVVDERLKAFQRTEASEAEAAKKKVAELREALISRSTATSASTGSNQDKLTPREDSLKLSPAELGLLNRHGLKPEDVKKQT